MSGRSVDTRLFSLPLTFYATLAGGLVGWLMEQAGIAADQVAIEEECGKGTTDGLASAFKVYSQGGHSKSYANLTLGEPLESIIIKDTGLSGVNEAGDAVVGKAMQNHSVGDTWISFQYDTSDSPDAYVTCRVGGLPSGLVETSGCK